MFAGALFGRYPTLIDVVNVTVEANLCVNGGKVDDIT
jgi:hypothetical protein